MPTAVRAVRTACSSMSKGGLRRDTANSLDCRAGSHRSPGGGGGAEQDQRRTAFHWRHPTSLLAKLRMGLRAIEQETSHLTPQVIRLNEGLTQVAGGLEAIDKHLVGTIDAAVKQDRYQ